MRRRHLWTAAAGVLVGVAAGLGFGAIITATDTQMPWSNVGSGGGSASSANRSVGLSVGQSAAGSATSAGFGVRLGFWTGSGVSIPGDSDGDGVGDITDNCPGISNPLQQNNVHSATFAGDHCDDPEPDTVMDITDNCPDVANTNQLNTDGDDYGNACEASQCVTIPNYWETPPDDADCDGFPSTIAQITRGPESFIGTSGSLKCAATATANDELTPDRWPVDMNDDQRANTVDVLLYVGNLNYLSPDPLYIQRFDLNGDLRVNTVDVLKYPAFLNEVCS